MSNYIVGTNYGAKKFNCLKCAERLYNKLEGLKYLKDNSKNKIILNTYGWKNQIKEIERGSI